MLKYSNSKLRSECILLKSVRSVTGIRQVESNRQRSKSMILNLKMSVAFEMVMC